MHVSTKTLVLVLVLVVLLLIVVADSASARNPIRNDFFGTYPIAVGTQLDGLPSDSNHCGVCHFDFGGGGPRNPYGLAIEVRINAEDPDDDFRPAPGLVERWEPPPSGDDVRIDRKSVV